MGLQQDPPQPPSGPLPMSPPPDVKPPQQLPEQATQNLLAPSHQPPALNDVTPPQLQLQIEADQQLAALQQHSQMTATRHWGKATAGSIAGLSIGQPLNGLDGPMSPDAQMGTQGSQGGSPFTNGHSVPRQLAGQQHMQCSRPHCLTLCFVHYRFFCSSCLAFIRSTAHDGCHA